MPESPQTTPRKPRALTANQLRVLHRILQTNGGGISVYGDEDQRTIMALHRRGLVQGKAGAQHRAVHTREGLELWRKLEAAHG